jgi:transmembrane sensor
VSKADENKAWDRFRKRVGTDRKTQAPVKQRNFSWMQMAGAIVVVVGIALISYVVINNAIVKELVVQADQTIVNDTLPDGSIVTLNKGSQISYPSRFKSKTREVVLKGEAFFKVEPNKNKPFIVRANNIQITVVGTSFNVKTENGITEVVVETGIVQVTTTDKTVELTAGERATVSVENKTPVKEQITDRQFQ